MKGLLAITQHACRAQKAFGGISHLRWYTREIRRNEPERMVRSELEPPDTEGIRVPYLREEQRLEIWRLHKENPEHWDYKRLAQKFGAAMERIRAVCILMKHREESMRADGVLEITDEWKSIWSLHKQDPVVNTAEFIANELKIEQETVETCIAKMTLHEKKTMRLNSFNKIYDNICKHILAPSDINTSFRETITDKSIRQLPKKFVRTFKPNLVNDDQFEAEKKRLIHRVINMTKAEADKSVVLSNYLATQEERLEIGQKLAREGIKGDLTNYKVPLPKIMKVKDVATTTTEGTNPTPSKAKVAAEEDYVEEPDDVMSRWKFAFRDLAEVKRNGIAPTMIRTRKGLWRVATPLEELNRSWQRKPSNMELTLNKKSLEKYEDFDGDEAELAELLQKRMERRARIKAELEAAKA